MPVSRPMMVSACAFVMATPSQTNGHADKDPARTRRLRAGPEPCLHRREGVAADVGVIGGAYDASCGSPHQTTQR